MKKRLKKCACGSDEFVSMPNRYDIYRITLKTEVGGEVLRKHVAKDALRAFVKAHLLVRRTKPRSADAATGFARRPDSTAVFRIKAKTACEGSGHRIADHFAGVGKIVTLGSEYPLDTRHAFHTLPRSSQPLRHTITMHTRKNHCPKHTALRFN
jgi:hypothetical protein